MAEDIEGPAGRLRASLSRALWGAIGIIAFGALPARATPISVTPTAVTLAPGRTTELISLGNEGDTTARFEVTLFSWAESQDGRTLLQPTQELIAFPPLFEIAPHRNRNVRVGAVANFSSAERSYRMIIQELPSAAHPVAQVQIQVLTKISLPVFLRPTGAEAALRIEAPRLGNGTLRFSVFNPGTAHLVLHRIEVAGDGGSSFEVGEAGWYLLAGGRRDYRLARARADCRKTSRITITVVSDGLQAKAQLPVAAEACGNATATRFIAADRTGTPTR